MFLILEFNFLVQIITVEINFRIIANLGIDQQPSCKPFVLYCTIRIISNISLWSESQVLALIQDLNVLKITLVWL